MMAWRSCCSPFGPFIDSPIGQSCGPCFRFASMFIVYPCRSKQDGGVVSRLTACPGPRPVKSSAPLPVASFALCSSVSSLVPSCRLAARLVLMPSRLIVPFSFHPVLPDVPHGFPSVLRSRRFVQLISSFSPHLAVIIAS